MKPASNVPFMLIEMWNETSCFVLNESKCIFVVIAARKYVQMKHKLDNYDLTL